MSISKEAPVPRAFDTIVWGGLLAGTLDAVDGVAAFVERHEPHPGPTIHCQRPARRRFVPRRAQDGGAWRLASLLHRFYGSRRLLRHERQAASASRASSQVGSRLRRGCLSFHELLRVASFSGSKEPVFFRVVSERCHRARNFCGLRDCLVCASLGDTKINAKNSRATATSTYVVEARKRFDLQTRMQ